jgi:CTP synthase
VAHIYDVPMAYHKEGLDREILAAFGIDPAPRAAHGTAWHEVSTRIHNPEGEVTIAIVGKYTGLKDAYKSLSEALTHGGIANKVKVKLDWIDSRESSRRDDPAPYLEQVHGILVPGGFGERGSAGKIEAAKFARERKTCPISASASACRWPASRRPATLAGIESASSTEFGPPRSRSSA